MFDRSGPVDTDLHLLEGQIRVAAIQTVAELIVLGEVDALRGGLSISRLAHYAARHLEAAA